MREFNLITARLGGGKITDSSNLEGFRRALVSLRDIVLEACYLIAQKANDLIEMGMLGLLQGVINILTAEDHILDAAISVSVAPLLYILYSVSPPLSRALERRKPSVELKADDIYSLRWTDQKLLNGHYLATSYWSLITLNLEPYRRLPADCILTDKAIDQDRDERGRWSRMYASLMLCHLGNFQEMRSILEDSIATLSEYDVGVTAYSDNHIQLCVAMIHLGDMNGVEEIYLEHIPGSPIHQTKDTKSNLDAFRRTAASAFKLQIELAMLYTLTPNDNSVATWHVRASESLDAIAKYGELMEQGHVRT
ncbi:hypothetical protein HK101_001507 [Irineochytrium annulatum]|nr:hypothetical protein HK101_001507 [Irineochytrium annulatum]